MRLRSIYLSISVSKEISRKLTSLIGSFAISGSIRLICYTSLLIKYEYDMSALW